MYEQMKEINYVFFEEYKKLEKLCGDMYNSHNGVTNYIDDMKSVSWSNYRSIKNWESDLKQLMRLRHIRNNLAHNEGAFDENVCTQYDIEWLHNFYKRILNQTDPLALKYKQPMLHKQKKNIITQENPAHYREDTNETTSISKIIISCILLTAYIILLTWFVWKYIK